MSADVGSRQQIKLALLAACVLFVTSVLSFQDLSFPLSMISDDGDISSEFKLAFGVEEGNPLRQFSIPMMAALGVYLFFVKSTRRFSASSFLAGVLVAYVAWIFLSLSWSAEPDLTLKHLFVFTFLSVGAVGLARLDVQSILAVVIIVYLATLTVGFANEVFLGTFAPWQSEYRFAGTMHPNLQATNMATVALAGLCCLLDPDFRPRWRASFLIALGTLVVILTQSRTSLISLVISSLFVLVVWGRNRMTPAMIIGAVIAVIIGALVGVLEFIDPGASPISLVMSLLERSRDEGDIQNLTGRPDIWATCIELGMSHPLTGFGWDSFWTPERIIEISSLYQWGINQAHSVYIEHFVTVGIVGLALWCILLLGSLIASLKRYTAFSSGGMLWIAGTVMFSIIHGFNEAIDKMPLFNGFILLSLIVHLALFQGEDTKQGTPVADAS